MAQSGYTPISLYYSTTASAAPAAGNLANGELAINITDKKLYAKDNGGNVFLLADASSGGTTATNLAGGAAGSVPYQSGANATTFLSLGTAAQVLQVNAGATAPEWVSSTGTGNVVRASSPTLTTPTLGAASATSINKVTLTAPATGSTLTIADGKTLTASNTLTLTGTDGSSVAFGTGGTVAYTSNNLSVFAATTSAQLAGVISDETGSGALVFGTSPTIATPTITTSATAPLVIGGTGTTSTLTLRSTSGVGTTGADIVFQTGNNGATEAMRVLNSGNVGIGTNAPTTRLTLSTNTTVPSAGALANTTLWAIGSDGATHSILLDGFGSGNLFTGRRSNGTAASPTAVLNGQAILRLECYGYGTTAYSSTRRADISLGAAETFTDTAQGTYISFSTTTIGTTTLAQRMIIDSSGNVGIGTGSQTAKLQLAGNSTASAWTTSGVGFRIDASTYTDSSTAASGTVATSGIHAIARPTIAASNATVTYTDAATLYVANAPAAGTNVTITNPYALYVAAGNSLFGGTAKFNTTIGVGNTTPAASGAGVSFPATQSASSDANTLDDYEEGTWTPALGGTTTYTTQSGAYTKIGNTVIASFDITINALGTGSNDRITGLPFTSANVITACLYYYGSLPSNVVQLTFGNGAAATTAFAYGATAAAATLSPIACWQNGTTIQGVFIYRV